MLTDTQREIFSKLLDKSYDLKKSTGTLEERKQLHKEVGDLEKELEDSMGIDNYENFMNMGRRMFS